MCPAGGGRGVLREARGVEKRAGMAQEHLARRSQAHSTGGPLEQGHAELVLEGQESSADRRLGETQTVGGTHHCPLFGNGDDRFQLIE